MRIGRRKIEKHVKGSFSIKQKAVEKKLKPISLTKEAALRVKTLMGEKKGLVLRFSDVAGHCGGGFGYTLKIVASSLPEDVLFTSHGVHIAVPKESLPRLASSEIQFREGVKNELFEDLLGEGFSVDNPNVKAPCKCGCQRGYTF